MTVRFGEFHVDSNARQLRRGEHDLRLSPKAFDLLCLLLGRRPDVIAKGDLLEAIWPDTYVVEANLNVLIGEIRRVLGDDPHAPRYVRTVHGIGYAFCAPAVDVKTDGVPAASRTSAPCWLSADNRAYTLWSGANLIGRDPRCDVWLDDSSVSRRHARIMVSGDAATLEDLKSTNGTFVGRKQLDSSTTLEDGDVVSIGSVRLTFRAWSDTAARTRRLRR